MNPHPSDSAVADLIRHVRLGRRPISTSLAPATLAPTECVSAPLATWWSRPPSPTRGFRGARPRSLNLSTMIAAHLQMHPRVPHSLASSRASWTAPPRPTSQKAPSLGTYCG